MHYGFCHKFCYFSHHIQLFKGPALVRLRVVQIHQTQQSFQVGGGHFHRLECFGEGRIFRELFIQFTALFRCVCRLNFRQGRYEVDRHGTHSQLFGEENIVEIAASRLECKDVVHGRFLKSDQALDWNALQDLSIDLRLGSRSVVVVCRVVLATLLLLL